MQKKRVNVLGVSIDCVDMDAAVEIADDFVRTCNTAQFIMASNPEKVIAAGTDEVVANALASASLVIPDGIGVVLAARLQGVKGISRVPGAELMPKLCELASQKGYPVFLYGAEEDVNFRASEKLLEDYPGLQIAGRQNGYLSADDMDEFINTVNDSGAKLMFLALGSPAQELWMAEFGPRLSSVRVCQGVGGTFDVLAGKVKRAPKLFRALHMEWLYRLLSDPRRIARQKALPKFVVELLKANFTKH